MKAILGVVLAIVVVGGAAAGGYAITRPGAPLGNLFGPPPPPPPEITVTSNYHKGTTPAGSASTTLHVKGIQFANSSSITFLLDNVAVSSAEPIHSDAHGNFTIDLTIGEDWAVGTHSLSAKDAQGHKATSKTHVAIVAQGEAHTPGPNGAPPDDTSFTLTWRPGGDNREYTLIITGGPDPNGGKVCGPQDDGKVHTVENVVDSIDGAQQATTCTGTYKGGKLTYTQTILSWQNTDPDTGLTCQESSAPQVDFQLTGTFSSATDIDGTMVITSYVLTCSDGTTNPNDAVNTTWAGTATIKLLGAAHPA
jgi:hypothetical protein